MLHPSVVNHSSLWWEIVALATHYVKCKPSALTKFNILQDFSHKLSSLSPSHSLSYWSRDTPFCESAHFSVVVLQTFLMFCATDYIN